MPDWAFWTGLFVLAVIVSVASTFHMALRGPSRARIAERLEKAGRDDALKAFVSGRSRYLLTTAIVRTAAVLAAFLAILHAFGTWSGDTAHVLAAFLLAFMAILVFGVAIPNAWSKYAGDSLLLSGMPLLHLLRWVCYPVILLLELFDPLVRRLAGVPTRDAQTYADELEQEILRVVSEGERHGAVDEEEKEMIESVIELSETRVEEIMTPRTDIGAIPKDADLDSVINAVRRTGHSRIPVYEGTIDTIVGILYAKDLLRQDAGEPFDLTSTMRKAFFIPESKLVRALLHEFQEQKVHIAVVLDEYGGTAGLVTIEDILEELVGEIADEYETDAPADIHRIDDLTVEVDARVRIDDLNDKLDVTLPEDGDYETIGGFVFSTVGKIPKVGEECRFDNLSIRVIAAEPRRITRLRLQIQPGSAHSVRPSRP